MTYNGSQELSEKEMLDRAREERRQIVEKYDIGREDGAVIDDWEDPKFEIYHTQDRFGFIHDQRLPSAAERSEKEQKQLDKEMSRVDKWLKMLNDVNKWFPLGAKYHEKMNERVWKGVPERMRGTLWRILLDLDRIKAEQEGKYQEMKRVGRLHSPDIRQIDLDVNRTYRDHIMFRERYNSRQQDLFHVLAAYSMYNTEIGYCQGMSQIAALLLMYLNSDEDAFWALSQLMVGRRFNMHGFFIPMFPKLIRFQEHHDKILMKKLRRLQKHLIAQNVDTRIYTFKWYFQTFIDRIPFSILLRVWDLYLLEGESILFAMAFTILKTHRKTLMKMEMEDLLEFLQKTLESDFGLEDDFVIETAMKESLAELRSSRLHTAGPIPDQEKPQKPFGFFEIPSEQIEVASVTREPASYQEKEFIQDSKKWSHHLNSQTSIDESSFDQSFNDTGSLEDPNLYLPEHDISLESPTTPLPQICDNTVATPAFICPPSPLSSSKKKDSSSNPDQSDVKMVSTHSKQSDNLNTSIKKPKKKQGEVRLRNDNNKEHGASVRRPVSADPGGPKGAREEVPKRLSAHTNISEFRSTKTNSGNQSQSTSNDLNISGSRTPSSQQNIRSSGQDRSKFSSRDTSRTSRTSSELIGDLGSSRLHMLDTSVEEESSFHLSNQSRSSSRLQQHFGRNSVGSFNDNHDQVNFSPQQVLHNDQKVSNNPEVRQTLDVSGRRSVGKTYYFGESPNLDSSQMNGQAEENNSPMAPHTGEVVRIRVPYCEKQDIEHDTDMQLLPGQQKSPKFNGHKVTIQVNHIGGDDRLNISGEALRPMDDFMEPIQLKSKGLTTDKFSSKQVSKCHISTKEKKVSASTGEVHTSTHSIFVSEHQTQMKDESHNGNNRQYRQSLNESYSSIEGETRLTRTNRSSVSEFSEKNQSDYRKETFF